MQSSHIQIALCYLYSEQPDLALEQYAEARSLLRTKTEKLQATIKDLQEISNELDERVIYFFCHTYKLSLFLSPLSCFSHYSFTS